MTKEELLQKINAGEYENPEFSEITGCLSCTLDGEPVNIFETKDGALAYLTIRAEINSSKFLEIKRKALQAKLDATLLKAETIKREIESL